MKLKLSVVQNEKVRDEGGRLVNSAALVAHNLTEEESSAIGARGDVLEVEIITAGKA